MHVCISRFGQAKSSQGVAGTKTYKVVVNTACQLSDRNTARPGKAICSEAPEQLMQRNLKHHPILACPHIRPQQSTAANKVCSCPLHSDSYLVET